MQLIPLAVDKIEAAKSVGRRSGQGDIDAYAPDLDIMLARAAARLPAHGNQQVVIGPSGAVPGLAIWTHFAATSHEPSKPIHLNGLPTDFPARTGTEQSPAFEVLELPDGYLAQVGHAPLALARDGRRVIGDFSSRYAGLVHFYDLPLPRMLADARRIEGAALVLCDDVLPVNYSHWLLDELPRLAFLRDQTILARDLTLVIAAPTSRFHAETLLRLGFPADRIVVMEDFTAVRAGRLLVPRDIRQMPHPAFKGAAWAVDFLRAGLAPPLPARTDRRIYLSRADSRGRYLVNEEALMQALAPLGYERVTLGLRSVAEQAALFGEASHVVGLHGAGLANLVFARPGTQVIELFPASYGTPAFYVVAAAAGCGYATYVAREPVVEQAYAQIHDAAVDIGHFVSACAELL